MPGRILLDTNVIIGLIGGETAAVSLVAAANAVFVPSVAIGELYYGAYKSARVEENVERVDEFARARSILRCDTDTARIYGTIKSKLHAKGRPIPDNDIWIAAIAIQYSIVLATTDRHFDDVEGLRVASPGTT